MDRNHNFESMKVEDLKKYLRQCGAKVSGNKPELLERAKAYFARAQNEESEEQQQLVNNSGNDDLLNLEDKREVFKMKGNWQAVTTFDKNIIPYAFDSDVISSFLTKDIYLFQDEEIQSGTEKPSRKGKDLYRDKKIQHCEFMKHNNWLVFRANMQASMKASVFRYPGAAIHAENGSIETTCCTCQQMSGGKCCHVGALLFLIEDLSLGDKPRLDEACTSKAQQWGKGSKVEKNPQPFHHADYGQKRQKVDKYYSIDPRPEHLRRTTKEELNNFITGNQQCSMALPYRSNWDSIFDSPIYEDYVLDEERKDVLKILTEQLIGHMESYLDDYKEEEDCTEIDPFIPLSTWCGVHLRKTLNQSENNQWFTSRLFRVTASVFLGKILFFSF